MLIKEGLISPCVSARMAELQPVRTGTHSKPVAHGTTVAMAAGQAAALPGRDGGRGGHTLPCRVHSRAWQLCLMALILHTIKMTVLIVLYHFF